MSAAHISICAATLVVLLAFAALYLGKVVLTAAVVCAPAIATMAATPTNPNVLRRRRLYAILGVLVNAITIEGLRLAGWPLFGVDSVELTTLLMGPLAVFVASLGVGLLPRDVAATRSGHPWS